MLARSIKGLLAATVIATAAACSSGTSGLAVPASDTGTDQPSTAQPAPSTGSTVPKVANPLDASALLAQPCEALTADQLRAMNLAGPGKADTNSTVANATGPACDWKNSELATYLSVGFLTSNRHGLADLYQAHQSGLFKGYWIEATVDGYPAVFHGTSDRRSRGNCNLAVGVSDTLAILIDEQDELQERSCDRAQQAASAVVQNLKKGH